MRGLGTLHKHVWCMSRGSSGRKGQVTTNESSSFLYALSSFCQKGRQGRKGGRPLPFLRRAVPFWSVFLSFTFSSCSSGLTKRKEEKLGKSINVAGKSSFYSLFLATCGGKSSVFLPLRHHDRSWSSQRRERKNRVWVSEGHRKDVSLSFSFPENANTWIRPIIIDLSWNALKNEETRPAEHFVLPSITCNRKGQG